MSTTTGRPKGSTTKPRVLKTTVREAFKALEERAQAGDFQAQCLIAQAALIRPEWCGLESKLDGPR